MKKYSPIVLFLFAFFIGNMQATFAGTYSGGDGTSGNPYLIATAEDLIELSNTSADWDELYFLQTANIAFNSDPTAQDWDGNGISDPTPGFSPIGNDNTFFTGNYHGDGNTISNLYINRSSTSYIGLFGRTSQQAVISYLGLINVDITGQQYVGGLVGYNEGELNNCHTTGSVSGASNVGGLAGIISYSTINNCYSTCTVTGTGNHVGGFVGEIDASTISQCYSLGAVIGIEMVGGFCGYSNEITITDCFSRGSVSGSDWVGGFVGLNEFTSLARCYSTGSVPGAGGGLVASNTYGDPITNCFWDTETSERGTSDGGTGRTTTQMKTQSTFTDATWNFTTIWIMNSSVNNGYPFLRNFLYAGGDGTDDPYLIRTKEHLNNVRLNLDKKFQQIANIEFTEADFEEGGDFYNAGAGWEPIGNITTGFTGEYNGNGYTISNLYINRSTDYIGLFGNTGGSAKISNLGLVNVDITGGDYVGGYGGEVSGTITKCYSTGSVTGGDYVGGFIGLNNSTINNCFTLCNVTGVDYVGGFVGFNEHIITNSYSVGSVIGTSNFGGFGGRNEGSTNNCYWDTETSGRATSGGAEGRTTAQMKTQSTFTGWDFDVDWNIESEGGRKSYPYLRAFTYDAVDAEVAVNPIPGLEAVPPYSGGAGTEGDPYQIATIEDLIQLSNTPSDWDKHFIQTAQNLAFNINPALQDWNGDGEAGPVEGFSPIGNSTTGFTGVYNGDGFTISNLFINRNTNNIGLFGVVESATITNLGLVNVDVTGGNNVGGFFGYNDNGIVSKSFSTGSVTGGNNVGGFSGYIINNSTISDSYTTASVVGNTPCGGFSGSTESSTISRCYSTGSVSGEDNVGGFAGFHSSGTYSNCFWDTQTSGQTTNSGGAEGRTTAQMKSQGTFTGWNFTNTWNIQSGVWKSYPYLQAFTYDAVDAEVAVNPIPGLEAGGPYAGGAGTVENPYLIETAEDLIELSNTSADWDKHFIQTADIAFNSDPTLQDWNGNGNAGPEAGFSPIGNGTTNFSGVYDGDGHTISNLFIDRSTDEIGLFGRTSGIAEISNLGLINVDITGGFWVGGLVGINSGTISTSYSTGSLVGNTTVGGFIGHNVGTISNSYSSGSVSGNDFVGGFVGFNENIISKSYSVSSVDGNLNVGGFVGGHNNGTTNDCFWDTQTSGQETSAGGTGKTTAEMKSQGTFTGWNFTNTWNIQSGVWKSYPYLQAFTYDTPGASPAVNPIPGLGGSGLYSGGLGTESSPYIISTKEDLIELTNTSVDWNKHFIQTENIAFNSNPSLEDWNGDNTEGPAEGWEPIGNSITNFSGVYDGDGHTISNLFINRNRNFIGLFGYLSNSTAEIKNLGLLNVNITGNKGVGGLVSNIDLGTITNCYSSGIVNGNSSYFRWLNLD